MISINAREAEIAKIAESAEARAALEKHIEEIVEGLAFRGSQRSTLFLRHVIHQAITGHFESLKERAIGMELFGRSPSYVTGEDAIVRVTASDVRKRLQQHYDKYGTASEFRVYLPLGSYVPEITREAQGKLSSVEASAHLDSLAVASGLHPDSVLAQEPVDAAPAPIPQTPRWRYSRPALDFAILSAILTIALIGTFWAWKHASSTDPPPVSVLPWSSFFSSPYPTHLVTSDPDIVGVQILTNSSISISDYANRKYIPAPNSLTSQIKRICLLLLRGDKAASVDTQVAVEISALAQSDSGKINVQPARSMEFRNLKTDDNFIFLGSPRSNPWVSLFDDQLDFRFTIDKTGLESILNVHPRSNEQPSYVPTAGGGFTGQSFAIIAFVQNPDQNGQVLLLAGANAEGTEVAGRFITDLPRVSMELRKCGIPSAGPPKHFELLLHMNMMAGSPSESDVLACHILKGTSAH